MDYKYSEGQRVVANYASEVVEAEIIYIDTDDPRLPYRLVTNKNTAKEDYFWVSEEDIIRGVGEVDTSSLLSREVTTLPELMQFLGEILIEFKSSVGNQPFDWNALRLADEFYDMFDAINDDEISRALEMVPAMKKAIQYEMGRAEREAETKRERIRQLREELARLEGE